MSIVSFDFDPKLGPVTQIGIWSQSSKDPPDPIIEYIFRGLVDTGADITCLSPALVKKLQLMPVAKTPMGGATGVEEVNAYDVRFGLVPKPQLLSPTVVSVAIECPSHNILLAPEFENQKKEFDVLIGRDILCLGYFSMSHDGRCIFAW